MQLPSYGKGHTLLQNMIVHLHLANVKNIQNQISHSNILQFEQFFSLFFFAKTFCFTRSQSSLFFCQTTDGQIIEPKMSASFVPDHKASMVLFLDRVYGIENQDFLLHVLEVGFLPDMRAAASLDTVRNSSSICDLNVPPASIQCFFVCMVAGCVQYHRDGLGAKPLPLLSCPAATHQVCAAVCRHGPPRHHDRLHAPHHLPPVAWQGPNQGPEGRHRGVPDVALQVSACCQPRQGLLKKKNI